MTIRLNNKCDKSIKPNKANMNGIHYCLKEVNEMDDGLKKMNEMEYGPKKMKDKVTKAELMRG